MTKPIGGAADLVVHAGQGLLRGTGWQADMKLRRLSDTTSVNLSVNSPLKFIWKMLVVLPFECRRILCAADASLLTVAKTYAPVTVVLTPQVLYVVGYEEDAHEHAFSVHELVCYSHPEDPTLLLLNKSLPSPEPLPEDADVSHS